MLVYAINQHRLQSMLVDSIDQHKTCRFYSFLQQQDLPWVPQLYRNVLFAVDLPLYGKCSVKLELTYRWKVASPEQVVLKSIKSVKWGTLIKEGTFKVMPILIIVFYGILSKYLGHLVNISCAVDLKLLNHYFKKIS